MDELCEENVMFPTGFVPSRLVWASVANVLWRDSGEFGHLLGFIQHARVPRSARISKVGAYFSDEKKLKKDGKL